MAAQFRSYASKGQFRGNLRVPDRASANRARDKEFIKELKEQNAATAQRDRDLISALKEKFNKEKEARKIVEDTRQRGVQAEKNQRIANAKLAADFAEQESKANYETIQQLTTLVPQIAETIGEIKEKRKEYDAQSVEQALEKAGLTPEQQRDFRASKLTAEEFATGTQAWLVALRESGGITWHQYNQMMQRTGGYGLGFERWDVRKLANSLPAFIEANGNIKNADGVSFNDALTSTDLPNNSDRQAIIEEFITKFKRDSGLINYSLAFRQDTLKGSLETQLNSFRTKANTTMHQQSLNAGREKDIKNTVSGLESGTLIGTLTRLSGDTAELNKRRNILIGTHVGNAAAAVENGDLSPDDALQLLNIEVVGPNGKKGRYEDVYEGRANGLHEAIYKRRQTELQRRNYTLQAAKQTSALRVLEAKQSILALPPSEQGEAVRAVIEDPNTPMDVREALNNWNTIAKNVANEEGLASLHELVKNGLPVTQEHIDLLNLSGAAKREAESMLFAQENDGVKELRAAAKSSIKDWIRNATGRESETATAHDQAGQVEQLMLQDWFRRFNALKGEHGNVKASEKALTALYESFKEGVDEDDPKGPYEVIRGKDTEDGLEMRFKAVPTRSHSSEYTDIRISEIYDKHGNRASQQPNILGVRDEEYGTWTDSSKVPRSVLSNARKLASITSEKDTYITILRDQVLLSNEPVPQWLDTLAASHDQAVELGVSRSTLELAGLEAADREQLKAKALSEIEVSSLPTYTGDLDGYDLGTDVSLPEGTPITLPIDVTIGQPVDGFPHAYTEPEGGRSFGHSIGNLITDPDENGAQVALMFGHLQDVSPLAAYPVGTRIPAGTIIGYSGNTGSTYPGGEGWSVLTSHATILGGAGFTPNKFMNKIIKPMYKMSIGGNQ